MKPFALSLAVAAALGLGAAPAIAQSSGGQSGQQSAPQGEAMTAVTDEKLASFVDAAEKVRGVMEEYRPQLEDARNDEERAELEQAANDAIVAALEGTPGITVQEYVQIARAARQDEELYDRITTMMDEG